MAATFPGVCAVVPAAGFGRRMQTECPKQYLSIGNKTILEHAVAALLANACVQRVVIAVSPGDRRFSQLPLAQHPQITVVDGGAERADSVLAGLKALPEAHLPASGRPQPSAGAQRNQPCRRDPRGAGARHHEARRAGQNRYRPYRRS